ncbi:DUF1800 domain-containing protein [Deminuibacter soli]|nr:DUF1800 domain-containing protein [Deminuibacter soli]
MVTIQQKNLHLLWRAGFGVMAEDLAQINTVATADLYADMEKKSNTRAVHFDVVSNAVKGLLMGVGEEANMQKMQRNLLTPEQRKQIRQRSREDLKNLNMTWLDEMVDSPAQLREKMSLFWHGHFACRDINIYYQQQLLNAIRDNATGYFGDLLTAVSKSASMLGFLNNQQNRKKHPNENFAREVMELFTLGRGHYTEKDIKEAARAFTGWGFNIDGSFVFRRFQHDEEDKTIFGQTGNFDGDDVLKLLLQKRETALFITQKIYRFFVNDIEDSSNIQWLANRFYNSNYHIGSLMRDIFTSEWFYEPKNMGCHIKSPVELMVGIRRTLPMEMENEAVQLVLQRALGQLLFYPPNVAGWPGGKNWIDSSSLMLRLRIPQLIKNQETVYVTPKADDDQQMGMMEQQAGAAVAPQTGKSVAYAPKGGFRINASVNWPVYMKQFDSVGRAQLFDVLQSILLLTPAGSVSETSLITMVSSATRESYIQTITIALMSTPEYQLC